MRLILVHGINQQRKSEQGILDEWLPFLFEALGRERPSNPNICAPFYGDRLAELTRGGAVAQGIGQEPLEAEEAQFLAGALAETAQAAGIGRNAIEGEVRRIALAEGGVVQEQSIVMNRRFNAIVSLLEKISPVHGSVVMRLLKQANAYLKRPGVAGKIDAVVRPVFEKGPTVIASHSLGTVITFKLLRQLADEGKPIDVPLLVTLGSPLPLMAIQAALGPSFLPPPGVNRWMNAVDPDDFVALGRGLDATTFGDRVENLLDVQNDPEDAHAIDGYLGDKRVAAAIAAACGF